MKYMAAALIIVALLACATVLFLNDKVFWGAVMIILISCVDIQKAES